MKSFALMLGLIPLTLVCAIIAEGEENTGGGSEPTPSPDEDAQESVDKGSESSTTVGNPGAPEPGAAGSGLAATESLDGHNEARTTGGHPGTTEPEPPTDEEGDEISQRAADAREESDEDDENDGIDPDFVDKDEDDDDAA